MAKIIISNGADIFRTWSEGDVLVTLSGVLPKGDLIAYEKEEGKEYANGVPVVEFSNGVLTPRVVAITSLTARKVEPVEIDGHKTKTPHYGEFNKGLLQRGKALLSDNVLRAVTVSECFPYEAIKVGKSTFEFDLVKIDWTDKYASVANGVLTFEGAAISIAEIVKHFDDYCKEQSEKL